VVEYVLGDDFCGQWCCDCFGRLESIAAMFRRLKRVGGFCGFQIFETFRSAV
jgi:hypothetical protein